jgi:hypothetical protein
MKSKFPRLSVFTAGLLLTAAMSPSIAMAARCSDFRLGSATITPRQYVPELGGYLPAQMRIVTRVANGMVTFKYYTQQADASWRHWQTLSFPCTR